MELISPVVFVYCFVTSPISYYSPPMPSWSSPQTLLTALFLIHYANRALLSPLRAPSRSKSHIIVPLSAIIFNSTNGFLMGSHMSSPMARIYLNSADTYRNPLFYVGLVLWGLGFAGNVFHDEILYDIRRKAKSKGKGKAVEDPNSKSPQNQEHYAIPQGWLFDYVSYPNYFCEWIEWLGFALAAAPFPLSMSSVSFASLTSIFSKNTIRAILSRPSHTFIPQLTPPYIFLLTEILLMVPRAYRGHQWYKSKFGEQYPKERKIVIPFLL